MRENGTPLMNQKNESKNEEWRTARMHLSIFIRLHLLYYKAQGEHITLAMYHLECSLIFLTALVSVYIMYFIIPHENEENQEN